MTTASKLVTGAALLSLAGGLAGVFAARADLADERATLAREYSRQSQLALLNMQTDGKISGTVAGCLMQEAAPLFGQSEAYRATMNTPLAVIAMEDPTREVRRIDTLVSEKTRMCFTATPA